MVRCESILNRAVEIGSMARATRQSVKDPPDTLIDTFT